MMCRWAVVLVISGRRDFPRPHGLTPPGYDPRATNLVILAGMEHAWLLKAIDGFAVSSCFSRKVLPISLGRSSYILYTQCMDGMVSPISKGWMIGLGLGLCCPPFIPSNTCVSS
ncbi:hypothetical protein GDO81_019248 [Engystomops pustulosus]|uniref:Uncharacterized protein n=1 Tax=Engystomops pustulosus TaxID=76066 RepID=A0AAV6ZFV9_ENGPU|nr:hypothetical protein GDO81_019248 [Engystomops pustulosus]